MESRLFSGPEIALGDAMRLAGEAVRNNLCDGKVTKKD